MHRHTTWYPEDQPDEAPQQLPPLPHSIGEPMSPFRFITFGQGAPYPDAEVQQPTQRPYMVDMLSWDQWHHGGSLWQPAAEDFFQPQYPLPLPPTEEHDSDQELQDMKSASNFTSPPGKEEYHYLGTVQPERRDAIAVPQQPLRFVKPDPDSNRSETASELPLVIPYRPITPAQSSSKGSQDTPAQVPTMAGDSYTPVLGGLQRLPSFVPLKKLKSERIRRWLSFGSRKRKYERASS